MSLNNVLLFSDELPDNHDECEDVVRFLRNLCRVVNIPSMLSSTNLRVTNLIGKRDYRNCGPSIDEGLTPWVKVVTKTPQNPKDLLKCLGCSIDVRLRNRKVKLNHYIDNGEIDVDRLLFDLIENNPDKPHVKSILEFLFEQLKTSLPGLITEIIKITCNMLSRFHKKPFDLKSLWPIIAKESTKILLKRKRKAISRTGIMSTIHILTFPSEWKNDYETAKKCTKNVNEHCFLCNIQVVGPKECERDDIPRFSDIPIQFPLTFLIV